MGEVKDYKIEVALFGNAALPSDWIYDGTYRTGELSSNTFGVTILRDGEKTILIDSGVNTSQPDKQAVFEGIYHAGDSLDNVLETLDLAGIQADEVTDVILTHAHIDHMGALELFPHAQFYIQREELMGWLEIADDPMMSPVLMPGVASEDDLNRARLLVEEGRMTLLDGPQVDLLPGIDVIPISNAHSIADQLVAINTPDGTYIDVGDVITRPEHLTGVDGIAQHYMWQSHCAGSEYLTMKAYPLILDTVNGDIDKVIIRHDSTLHERREPRVKSGNSSIFTIR